jgi:hypothetical protein
MQQIAFKFHDVGRARDDPFCVMHQVPAAAQRAICFCALPRSVSLAVSATSMEVRRVDLTMKVDVLAVCAAFVFVGAILLGAF